MAEGRYLDFELLIAKTGRGYRAQVVESPSAGEAVNEFRLPFSKRGLELLLLKLGRPRVGVLGVDSPQLEAAREFGGKLFGAAFGGEVLACLRASLEKAEREGAGLRIRLRLTGTPELADLPWEFLYDRASRNFLALAAETPIVRYLDLAQSIKPLAVRPPLHVLAAISSPPEWEPIDAEREWAALKAAFSELERGGRAVLERIERATVEALQERLWKGEVHVFHFVAHGGFRDQRGEGVLVFEDEQRGGRLVSAEELGTLLRNHPSLRLAMLNACEGARADPKDPFGGTAQTLVQQGLPAVIAMQFPITMAAAARLARTFYAVLGAGFPVDRALTEARVAIRSGGNELEWATPVLFLRSADGRIFDLPSENSRIGAADGQEHQRIDSPPVQGGTRPSPPRERAADAGLPSAPASGRGAAPPLRGDAPSGQPPRSTGPLPSQDPPPWGSVSDMIGSAIVQIRWKANAFALFLGALVASAGLLMPILSWRPVGYTIEQAIVISWSKILENNRDFNLE